MKNTGIAGLFFFTLLSVQVCNSFGQALSVGVGLGATGFLGDLGGANYIGRPFVFDLEKSLTKPAASLFLHYSISRRVSFKGGLTYTSVAGDDKLIQPTSMFSPEWFRWYRNLSFQSTIIEGAVTCEVNLKQFVPGSKRYRFAPYLFAGFGVFHFNPKTTYNGQLIELRPLHTEGEGFDSLGVKEYSLIQPVIPAGIGLRYNLSSSAMISFEYRNNFSFTDYIDDVSKKYVSQSQFNQYFSDPATAALAFDVSARSDELDPEGIYAVTTAPGQQRGDKNKDQYEIFQVSLSFILFNNTMGSSGFSSRRIYAHRVKHTDDMFRHKPGKQYYYNKTK